MDAPIRLGLVGLGKIARDQHLPTISRLPAFKLVAVADPAAHAANVVHYDRVEDMLAHGPELDAVVLCQPTQFRFAAAKAALQAGKHVMMEKPPGKTVAEVQGLTRLAGERGVALFASWHSRCAPAVGPAKALLKGQAIGRVVINWREDVRVWHPGQSWLWRAGGLGVFDPGINALSILTEIIEAPIHVVSARFELPVNAQSPIAAHLALATISDAKIDTHMDFRANGDGDWSIEVQTDTVRLAITGGGSALAVNGVAQAIAATEEYTSLYEAFGALISSGKSDVDVRPLQLVADAFLVAETTAAPAFSG